MNDSVTIRKVNITLEDELTYVEILFDSTDAMLTGGRRVKAFPASLSVHDIFTPEHFDGWLLWD